MADNNPSTIVPPTPTITQSHSGPVAPPGEVDTSPGLEAVQRAFDKAYPMRGAQPSTVPPPLQPVQEPPKPAPEPKQEPQKREPAEPVKPPEAPAKEKEREAESETALHKMPSFLEEALKVEPVQPTKAAEPEEWPEELPPFKTPEESKSRYKNWRESYRKLKEENNTLKSRPFGLDEGARQKMEWLENQNKEMATTLSRFGVEQNTEFQQNIIRPLYGAWNEACRIVKDSGQDPNELSRAMSLSGKTQFEALDELMRDMPQSAKAEVHDALRAYRRLEDVRRNAMANAPQTFQELRKREMEREYATLNKQRDEMHGMFEEAIRKLRDEAKVEVLQKTDDPEAKWWNDQAEAIEKNSRDLYLENTDLRKMAMACVLAPMADAYRKMWLAERIHRTKAEKTLKEKFGAEPSLTESGGANGELMPEEQMKADLKRPFSEVFLREFHRAQSRNR